MEAVLRVLIGLASVIVCAVPRRYRQTWPLREDGDLRAPAIASGALETLIGAPGAALYVAVGLKTASAGLGVAGLILNPYLPLLFMFLEGLVRTLAAVGSHQILPTLPLQIVAWIHDAVERKAGDRELGPVVMDAVEQGDGRAFDLMVLSCRAKEHWNPYMTIRYEGQFYQMFQQEMMSGSRKFAYFLRKSPEWRHVVVVYEYHPGDVLNPKAPVERWKP
jgi:hypothetical protein